MQKRMLTVNETVNNVAEMMLMGFLNEYYSGYSFEIQFGLENVDGEKAHFVL